MPFFLEIHDEPADRIGLREIFVVQCEKYSDIFRTRPKKQRELQQLAQNTIVAIKCSFRLGSRPWIRFRFYVENPTVPLLAGKQPRQYFLGLSAAPLVRVAVFRLVNWRIRFCQRLVDSNLFVFFF